MRADATRTAAALGLERLRDELRDWLIDVACPLWQLRGIDASNGSFEEALGPSGLAVPEAHRARVQPRQVYAFTTAAKLGWRGDAASIARRGIDFFSQYYRRGNGLFRTLVGRTGAALDDAALLYDQAFALLGFAAAAAALNAHGEFEERARALRTAIGENLSTAGGGYRSSASAADTCESNPNMHLLESCLAWAEIGGDPTWTLWAEDLVRLATNCMPVGDHGAIVEVYDTSWQPAADLPGRRIEPGHQFEWAWLLLRSGHPGDSRRRGVAMRLIDLGEAAGVRDGFVVNALRSDLTVLDGRARLWPQTERLKATALAAALTGEEHYWQCARQAAQSLLHYLETPLPGLWFDLRLASGEFLDAPAPASSFYHVVGAIAALDSALAPKEIEAARGP